MSEPPSISRRAAAWWPAVVGLEQVMQAVTATALAARRGASVPADGVRQLAAVLRAIGAAAAEGGRSAGGRAACGRDAQTGDGAVRALLGVLNSGDRLSARPG